VHAGAAALVAGVVFIRDFPAEQVIWAGSAALVAAKPWGAGARRRRAAG
jgi:hypothetical protein